MSIAAWLPLDAWLSWIVAASWQLALLSVVIAVATAAFSHASPRLRHALWLLVIVKVFLPPSWSAPWGVGSWGVAPLWQQAERVGLRAMPGEPIREAAANGAIAAQPARDADAAPPSQLSPRHAVDRLSAWCFLAWAAGCLLVGGGAAIRYAQLRRQLRRMQLIDEGPWRIELERIAMQLGERRVPELLATADAGSPFLVGVWRPAIVVPEGVLANPDDARDVLFHELVHWRRRDPWIGCVQAVAQTLFWFHPAIWWANRRMRDERELACDAAVLGRSGRNPAAYGGAILNVLRVAGGRSIVEGGLVGVFERGTNIQQRLEAIMNFQNHRQRFGAGSWAAVSGFALLGLPMGMPAAVNAAARDDAAAAGKPAVVETQAPPRPWFASEPASGATDVDPALPEIVLKFDRAMGRGMSWTGDANTNFPTVDKTRQAGWRDERTCVLPVKLERGAYYRFGVNAKSFQNFRTAEGVAVPPAVVWFTTSGASPALQRRVKIPQVVDTEPAHGAQDVDPQIKALRVTFDMPMAEGCSWTGDVPAAEGGQHRWSRDGRTCILPVQLARGTAYRIGLNSMSHNNFQSRWGVPLEPAALEFRTR